MKHITFELNDEKNLAKAIKHSRKKRYSSQLIQIFSAQTKKKKLQKIVDQIVEYFPDALVIGATTAGEISHAKMYEDSTVVSLSLFEHAKLQAHYSTSITKESALETAKEIIHADTKAAIILSEGLKGEDYLAFIQNIQLNHHDLLIAGGLAGDNFKLKKTFIIYKKKVLDKGVISVSLSSKKLYADNRYNLNWSPIGKSFTITKSEGSTVHTIDNIDAVTLFKHYLGEKVFHNNAASLPDFQLLYKEGETVVSRTPLVVDGNSLVFAGPLKEGLVVQFGFANAAGVLNGANEISKNLSNNPAQGVYIYSCIARKTLLGKILEKEFASFESLAPTAGFFTYGEFYSTEEKNALLNCTTTLLVLAENSKRKKRQKNKQIHSDESSIENITFSALTHFIDRTSNELKENAELLGEYKKAVDVTSLVSKTDLEGNITYVNDNFCRISQYSQEELIGQNHRIVKDPAMSSHVFNKMWHTLIRGKTWHGLLSNKAKDGSIYFVDATILPLLDEEGEIKEYIAIRQDVSKQIQSKKRMKEKERLIKAIFDNQESIVIYASKTKGMLSVNKQLFAYLDFKNIEDFKQHHTCICDHFIEEPGYLYTKKYPNWINDISDGKLDVTKAKIKIKDGSVHTFHINIKHIENEYIINLNDITDLENALNKAYLSEQTKANFLANMSHEIRTPLNGILGFADVLSKKELDSDALRYVDIIKKSGDTLLNVVNDILDFSKLESGELSLYTDENNLFEEMEVAVATFASVAKNKQIEYFTYIDPNIPKILNCDIQRIKQVLNNLLSNAVKFTPDKGEVKVKIKLNGIINERASIHFSVKDSGIGIAKDKIDSIFNSFSQADDSISREFGGTGLGLAISSRYIEMMKGKISVKSEEGEGSEFYFDISLPIIDDTKALEQAKSTEKTKIKILDTQDALSCSVNSIVTTYLDAWQWEFDTISRLDELDDSIDILIVCAKLFENDACKDALERYKGLHLIYIEGGEENLSYTHPKFHLIEQPMTGSALFDQIITLSNSTNSIAQSSKKAREQPKYSGSVLVAEDNLTNQALISILLDERGIQYTLVNNGKEAVEEAFQEEYDLILMDINMPVLDGISATKQLRNAFYKKTIVSLSANVIAKDREGFLLAGIDDTLNKPLIPKELDIILDKYLKKEDKKEPLKYDKVAPQVIADALQLPNLEIIKKLLLSFQESVSEIYETLQTQELTKALAHNIRGVTGNLRFNITFKYATEVENSIESWSDTEIKKAQEKLSKLLKNLIDQIDTLYK